MTKYDAIVIYGAAGNPNFPTQGGVYETGTFDKAIKHHIVSSHMSYDEAFAASTDAYDQALADYDQIGKFPKDERMTKVLNSDNGRTSIRIEMFGTGVLARITLKRGQRELSVSLSLSEMEDLRYAITDFHSEMEYLND